MLATYININSYDRGFKDSKQSIKTNKFGTEIMSNFLSCKTLDYETEITKKLKLMLIKNMINININI